MAVVGWKVECSEVLAHTWSCIGAVPLVWVELSTDRPNDAYCAAQHGAPLLLACGQTVEYVTHHHSCTVAVELIRGAPLELTVR